MVRCSVLASAAALALWTIVVQAGCTPAGPTRHKVSGTVKYKDGSVPQGEVRTIRFEPASLATGTPDPNTKAASGTIMDDGSFQLSTLDENDGAFPGDYKVTFTIKKTYAGEEHLVDKRYMQASTTPLSATVKGGDKNVFNFEIEKRK